MMEDLKSLTLYARFCEVRLAAQFLVQLQTNFEKVGSDDTVRCEVNDPRGPLETAHISIYHLSECMYNVENIR